MTRQSTIESFLKAGLPRQSSARSISRETTLSCITVENGVSTFTSDDPTASTPPTSVDGNGSNHALDTKSDEPASTEARPRRTARTSVASYNENVLSRSTRQLSPAPTATDSTLRRALSRHSLVHGKEDAKQPRDHLLGEMNQILDLDWRVDALPGERMDLVERHTSTVTARKPGRSKSLLRRASAAVDRSTSVLGKRTRELVEAGKASVRDLGRRTSLRPRGQVEAVAEVQVPNAKKRRVNTKKPDEVEKAAAQAYRSARKSTIKPRSKKYLAQGLYVGQEADFDPRFNPAQKSKRASNSFGKQQQQQQVASAKQRKILPLPMFAGERLLISGRDFKMPFDVFNPLPPGQPKPDEWRRTQRNVFVGDAADYWKVGGKLEHSTCICAPEDGCGDNCFNRFMFYECDKNNCNVGPEYCTNRAFEDLRKRLKAGGKYNVGVEVMKTMNKGYGVRSCRSFAPGQIIVEYTGEIVTQDECDHRMRTEYKDNECFYLMMFDQNMIIDATRGSIARFVNHSCEPNCRMVKWTVDRKPRMALFAGDRGIMTGDELTYDYNFDPFSAKNIQECHCGMPSCRGVLGPKPKEREAKEASLKPSIKEKEAEREAGGVGVKRKIMDAVDGIRSKKRRFPADSSTMLKDTAANGPSTSKTRAARAALRADIKGAKSKRVAAAKLTKKRKPDLIKGRKNLAVRPTTAATDKVGKRVVSGRNVVKASSGADGKITVRVNKKTIGSRQGTLRSTRSNVVRTLRGADKPLGVGKTIKTVDVFDVPDW